MNRWVFLILFLSSSVKITAQKMGLINGVTVVAPPQPIDSRPMTQLVDLGANWIAVIPYGYSRVHKTQVHYDSPRQWWGERLDGARTTIKLAQSKGLKVLLKPHVYVPSAWPGAIDFVTEEDWVAWEKEYSTFILDYAKLATELNVGLFSIGTEFVSSTRKRHDFWHDLITEIKHIYSGKLTYSANWDEYTHVPFWEELDFIGVDAYFPLIDGATPSVEAIVDAWQPHQKLMERISQMYNRPILFTEYGYLSVDHCAHKTWELEKNIHSAAINQQAQANAIEGLFKAFEKADYWAGGFYWKWFPDMQGHEGYPERDYTFQGKIGEGVIKRCFFERVE